MAIGIRRMNGPIGAPDAPPMQAHRAKSRFHCRLRRNPNNAPSGLNRVRIWVVGETAGLENCNTDIV